MLSPDVAKFITAALYVVAVIILVRQMWWQRRVGIVDQQARSAFVFLLFLAIVCSMYVASYLGFFSFGNTDRGPVFVFLFVCALAWWNNCTERHNAHVLKQMEEHKRTLRRPLGSVNGED